MWILGCGYIGRRVARRYLESGRQPTGIVRRKETRDALIASGIPAIACDLGKDSLAGLELGGEQVFHFAPPPAHGVEDLNTRRLISELARAGNPRRLVYISTTGVYGDCGGAWVDETRPAAPAADRARRRRDAEEALQIWARDQGHELVILRVAGIYGPDRLPLERIRRRVPLVRPDQSPYSNRVHTDDVVAACVAAMERGAAGEIYNVADGHPSTMTDYFLRLAGAADLPPPPVLPLEEAMASLSPGMLSYLRESRRLSNRRMREGLGIALRYPHLDEGLAASLQVSAG